MAADMAGDPHELSQRARHLLEADGSRDQAEAMLANAVAIWEKRGAKSDDYAQALLLLGMARNPALAKNKDALETQVEPLARKAVELRQANPDTKVSDMALALEFDALVLEELGRIDDSRDPKAKARALRDGIIVAMQPPADSAVRGSFHMGVEVKRPALIAMTEPHLTFYARLLQLKPQVIFECIVGTDGLLHNIEVFKPAGFGLDENAVQALMQWRLRPAQKNGAIVPVEITYRLDFEP